MIPEITDEENRDVDTGYEVDLANLEAACAPVPGLTFSSKKSWKKLARGNTKTVSNDTQILGTKRKEKADTVMTDVEHEANWQEKSLVKKFKGNGVGRETHIEAAGSGEQTRRSP
ncbi:hypothetical protein RIF29_25436 [Crotalaria pallida]|uniref:Uncharacterized protein n=1 Tax=Crotalaria pallida TaxID=3830 RepID=A0AAN9EM92_CROPI